MEFDWKEREGRGPEGTPFHEWSYEHGSGRIVAVVRGPQDERGGFEHIVVFLFSQEVSMQGAPFVYADFDSAKRFAETHVSELVSESSPEGKLTVTPIIRPEVAALQGALSQMGRFAQSGLAVAIPFQRPESAVNAAIPAVDAEFVPPSEG